MSDDQAERPEPSRYVAVDTDAFDCPNCGAYAHQNWAALTHMRRGNHVALVSAESDGMKAWQRAICSRCTNFSVWRGDQMIWPAKGTGVIPHPDMPGGSREIFMEASAVAMLSRRAGAALARATLECLITTLDSGGTGTLYERIGRIKTRTSHGLGQMLDVVRVAGNDTLHSETSSRLAVIVMDSTEGAALVEILLETSNRLVQELITQPQQDESWWSRLPDGVRRSIEQRDSR